MLLEPTLTAVIVVGKVGDESCAKGYAQHDSACVMGGTESDRLTDVVGGLTGGDVVVQELV